MPFLLWIIIVWNISSWYSDPFKLQIPTKKNSLNLKNVFQQIAVAPKSNIGAYKQQKSKL